MAAGVSGAVGMDVDGSDDPSTTAEGAKPERGHGAKAGGLISLDRGTSIKVTPLYGVQGTSSSSVCACVNPHNLAEPRRLPSGSEGSLTAHRHTRDAKHIGIIIHHLRHEKQKP